MSNSLEIAVAIDKAPLGHQLAKSPVLYLTRDTFIVALKIQIRMQTKQKKIIKFMLKVHKLFLNSAKLHPKY